MFNASYPLSFYPFIISRFHQRLYGICLFYGIVMISTLPLLTDFPYLDFVEKAMKLRNEKEKLRPRCFPSSSSIVRHYIGRKRRGEKEVQKSATDFSLFPELPVSGIQAESRGILNCDFFVLEWLMLSFSVVMKVELTTTHSEGPAASIKYLIFFSGKCPPTVRDGDRIPVMNHVNKLSFSVSK